MGGKKKKAKAKQSPRKEEEAVAKEQPEAQENDDVGERLTLDALDAISSSEDEEEEEESEEWNAEAQALRQAIADGAFDHLMKDKKKATKQHEEEVVEVALEDDDDESEEEDEKEAPKQQSTTAMNNNKALVAVVEQLELAKRNMPWAETLHVVSGNDKPLPFDLKRGGNPLDVHDDLKREVAFYDAALDAVHVARVKCAGSKIPFTRPDDFMAEMVKTDDHMARIKDRLIFETKKMDAFAQRKANQEHKRHAKETQAFKLELKAKRKRQHFDALEKWQSNNNNAVLDDESPVNRKRMAADKRYGHGGKRGRFKQNTSKDLNDMSLFRPKGSASAGAKRQGAGKKRPGKRARDAARSRH